MQSRQDSGRDSQSSHVYFPLIGRIGYSTAKAGIFFITVLFSSCCILAIGGWLGLIVGATMAFIIPLKMPSFIAKYQYHSEEKNVRSMALGLKGNAEDSPINDIVLPEMLNKLNPRFLLAWAKNTRTDQELLEFCEFLRAKGINIPLPEKIEIETEMTWEEGSKEWLKRELKSLEDLERAVTDPISLEMITNPVIADDGNIYDLKMLQEYYDWCISHRINPKCPKDPNQLLNKPTYFIKSRRIQNRIKLVKEVYGSLEKLGEKIKILQKRIAAFPKESSSAEPLSSQLFLDPLIEDPLKPFSAGYFKPNSIFSNSFDIKVNGGLFPKKYSNKK
ncbi:MAG: hypothetical protein K0R24_2237 [Gammaproteobacteria bacterium]|jgi:hypothetical protein|nr:hypothetical protein [Gammaproteobacteria bacterium]